MSKESKHQEIDLRAVYGIPLHLVVTLGTVEMKISELLKLNVGAILSLDKKVGDPVEIQVNGRLIARGEVVVADGNIGITITEIVAEI